jgi:hypothetical protein
MKRKISSSDVKVKDYVELNVADEAPALPPVEPTDSVQGEGYTEPVAEVTEFVTVLDEDGEVCIVPADGAGEDQSTELSES